MTHQVLNDEWLPMDAHADVDESGIDFHSRGGSSKRGKGQNADYGPALRLLLRRLAEAAIPVERAWVNSSQVQALPLADRTILRGQSIRRGRTHDLALRLKYVKRYASGGKVWHYFRKKGRKPVPLPGLPGSAEFMAAYQAALDTAQDRLSKYPVGSVGEMIVRYYSSVEFTDGLKPSSKALYRQVLEPVRLAHGHRTVKGLDAPQARKILEKIGKDRPGMANLTRAVMHKVMKLARAHPNPFAGIPPHRIGTHHTWTEQELMAYEAKWPLGTRERLAYAALAVDLPAGGRCSSDAPAGSYSHQDRRCAGEDRGSLDPDPLRAVGPLNGVFLIGDDRGRPMT